MNFKEPEAFSFLFIARSLEGLFSHKKSCDEKIVHSFGAGWGTSYR